MRTLVFFLEEPSAKAMLEGLLPRILPADILPRYVVFEGKQDLEKQLVRRLRNWLAPETQFVILRDQDSGDCRIIKSNLVEKCREAGRSNALVRIACRELESWYLGDLAAVESAFQIRGLATKASVAKYRNPDLLANAKQEMEHLTHGNYQEVAGSRVLGSLLDFNANRSRSFQILIKGIQNLAFP